MEFTVPLSTTISSLITHLLHILRKRPYVSVSSVLQARLQLRAAAAATTPITHNPLAPSDGRARQLHPQSFQKAFLHRCSGSAFPSAHFPHEMDEDSGQCDARLIQTALAQGAEACILLLHSQPHLRHLLITDLLRSSHQLGQADILRIFSLSVFGYEPAEAIDFLQQLKPAGYCGHVFKEGEISYKCAAPFQRPMCSK